MTEINTKLLRSRDGSQRGIATPLPTAKALSLSTAVKRAVHRRRYSSKELTMTEVNPTAVTIVEAKEWTPPPQFAVPARQPGDPNRLSSSSSPSNDKSPRTDKHPKQQESHRTVEVIADLHDGAAVRKPWRILPTAREGREGEAAGDGDDDVGHGLSAGERKPKEFQCPQVPRMVLTLLIFTTLVQGFSAGAISLFTNMELALGPVEVTRYWMYIGYTAWCQPLIGYLSDALVLFGEKRRPLFMLAAVGNTIVFFLYCAVPAVTSTYGRFVGMSIVSQFFTMGLYIPLNGLVVEVGRHDAETEEESMARMSAIMSKTMVWRSIGGLMGNILQTVLVLRLGVHSLLGVTSALFVLLVPLVLVTPRRLFLRSGTQDQNFYKRVAEAGRLVWRSFDIHDMRSDGFCFVVVLAFVFVYTMMPDAGSVYYNYLYGAFTFPAWFYSLNNSIGYFGSIAGAYVFSLWMDHRALQEASGGTRTSLFFIFMIGSFAWALGYITNLLLCIGFITDFLGIPAIVYVPVDNFFMSLFVRFAFMPTITMAAEHAPKFFEATTFEVFSVASMGGGTISSLLTSYIAQNLGITRNDYSALWILIIISIVLKLVPIPLAYLLPERHSITDAQPTIEGDDDATVKSNADDEEGDGNACKKKTEGVAETTIKELRGISAVPAVSLCMQQESFRMSENSEYVCDPSVPLTRRHRNLM